MPTPPADSRNAVRRLAAGVRRLVGPRTSSPWSLPQPEPEPEPDAQSGLASDAPSGADEAGTADIAPTPRPADLTPAEAVARIDAARERLRATIEPQVDDDS